MVILRKTGLLFHFSNRSVLVERAPPSKCFLSFQAAYVVTKRRGQALNQSDVGGACSRRHQPRRHIRRDVAADAGCNTLVISSLSPTNTPHLRVSYVGQPNRRMTVTSAPPRELQQLIETHINAFNA